MFSIDTDRKDESRRGPRRALGLNHDLVPEVAAELRPTRVENSENSTLQGHARKKDAGQDLIPVGVPLASACAQAHISTLFTMYSLYAGGRSRCARARGF